MRHTVLLALVFFVMPAHFSHAGAIKLRRAVRMPQDREVLTLDDLAILEGADALTLADTEIWTSPDPARLHNISRETIQKILGEVGVQWSSMHLSGGDITVRPRASANATAPMPMQPLSIDKKVVQVKREHKENTFLAAGIMHERTLRGAIALRFVQTLQIDAADLRLTFDLTDEELLATDLNTHRIEVQPTSSLATDRSTFVVRFWEDGAVTKSEGLTVRPVVRASLSLLTRDVKRSEQLLASDFRTAEQWISPALARRYPKADDLIGLLATRNMNADSPVRDQDVMGEMLITRGDRVRVRCVSGNVVITLQAEARGDAALGEEVELRKLGERDTFFAKVTASGEAVVRIDHG